MNIDIYLTDEREWNLTLQEIIDKFPKEYEFDKADGLTDEQFARRTFDEMGPDHFSEVFPPSRWDGEYSLEAYE